MTLSQPTLQYSQRHSCVCKVINFPRIYFSAHFIIITIIPVIM